MIGKLVSYYRIDAKLGAGGMGTVYLAQDLKLDRTVAIKLLHPAYTNHKDTRARFKQEAKILAQMQHPNIVTLHDYIEDESGIYLIMEYIKGLSLDDYIRHKTGPIPEGQTVLLMKQILQAFGYAHQRGVIHRDIKPSNIIVTEDKRIKILDFGIAKMMEQTSYMTKTGTKMGTVMFMSPEQIQKGKISIQTDIYSLGVTLFQMITGKVPYDEKMYSEYDVIMKIIQEPLPKLKEIYPFVSEGMQKIVDKATAKAPEQRFANTNAFEKELDFLITNNHTNISDNSQVSPTPPPLSSHPEEPPLLSNGCLRYIIIAFALWLLFILFRKLS